MFPPCSESNDFLAMFPAAVTSQHHHARRAAGRLVLSSSLFALMAVLAKLAARRIPGAEVAFVRFAAGVAVTIGLWAAGRVDIRPRRWRWLAARGFFGGTAVLAYFACIQLVPVGEATLLNQTQPVYTLLFAWALLGERPRRALLVALPLTLLGTALVVDLGHGVGAPGRGAGWGAALGVISAVASGVAVTSVRAARRRLEQGPPPETAWSVFFSFTTLGLLVTLPTVLPPFGRWVTPAPREWALLAGMGGAGVGGQVVMSEALQHLGGASAGVISQLSAVLTVAAGVLLLGDPLTPSFVGGALLTLAGVAVAVVATGPAKTMSR
jgi:drug/metabolite transporter (DMT)-like permease